MSYASVRPIGPFVLVLLDESEAYYPGTRILIPQQYTDVAESGVVVAVGGGDGHELQPGDRVRFRRWNMTEVLIDDELHILIPEDDILYTENP